MPPNIQATTPSITTKVRLVAVVVTHNRLAQLQVTLAQLSAARNEGLDHVIVVDNASTDGTADWLATQLAPGLTVHREQVNGGGAGGFETGMRHAVARFDPDWILVMDDDARPDPGAVVAFLGEDRSDAVAWAAAVYHPDGRICDMNRPTLNPFWHHGMVWRTLAGMLRGRGRDGFHLNSADYLGTAHRAIDSGSFVGLFISRTAMQMAGYPDPSLFIYGDDVLYSLKLRQAGGTIMFDPRVRFEHDFTTMAGPDRQLKPLWKTYYHCRNLMMVYRLAAGPWFWLVLPLVTLKWMLKLRYHGGVRVRYLALLARGVRDGVRGHTDVAHEQVLAWAAPRKRKP
ncbi:MAG: glycosyltransferase [Sulfitobacter sp.]